jgi:hypothetical protein
LLPDSAGIETGMLVRLFGALCGAWRLDEAFAPDLLGDVTDALDGALARDARPSTPRARRDAA